MDREMTQRVQFMKRGIVKVERIVKHERILVKHERILVKHERILVKHERILVKHERILVTHERSLVNMNYRFKGSYIQLLLQINDFESTPRQWIDIHRKLLNRINVTCHKDKFESSLKRFVAVALAAETILPDLYDKNYYSISAQLMASLLNIIFDCQFDKSIKNEEKNVHNGYKESMMFDIAPRNASMCGFHKVSYETLFIIEYVGPMGQSLLFNEFIISHLLIYASYCLISAVDVPMPLGEGFCI